jgi:hypothetical protein
MANLRTLLAIKPEVEAEMDFPQVPSPRWISLTIMSISKSPKKQLTGDIIALMPSTYIQIVTPATCLMVNSIRFSLANLVFIRRIGVLLP